MYRVLYVSIRGPKYLLGNTTVHPVDAAAPTGVGTRFTTLEQVERHVAVDLRGVSTYWRVEVIDEHGAVVRLGTRAGRNGTGERWTWPPPA
jgi:hypothetical protein